MIPRPYQADFVERSFSALRDKGNTLGVAPTGAGKTLMIAWLLEQLGGQQLVLQHREELVYQNLEKFKRVVPHRTTSICGMGTKDMSGETIFGMIQTMARKSTLDHIPPLDVLMVDEAHHAVASSYQRVIEQAREQNPNCLIAGVTATPARGDRRGLRPIFDNVSVQILLKQLISLGFLVPYRTFIASLPGLADEIQNLEKTNSGEYDPDDIDTLMNTKARNDAVLREWERLARDRKTIVFCSTKNHARAVCATFRDHGVKAECIFGDTPEAKRKELLLQFDKGDLQVLFNVAVLTEGYDSQPVSCIMLLRPCSFKSTMIQMIGRGLRTVDPEEYPGVVKRDCLVLDFGESLKAHFDLEIKPQLEDLESTKVCDECEATVPSFVPECPICGYVFSVQEPGEAPEPSGNEDTEAEEADVVLTEVDIMNKSPFRWVDLFGSGKIMMANGFDTFVAACAPNGQEDWVSLGKVKGQGIRHLAVGAKPAAISAADDFMRLNEDNDSAKKTRRWMKDPATLKQIELLEQQGFNARGDFNIQKYQAACLLSFFWNRQQIERILFS
jgi:superfamily II DNA or RNA helicase